MEMEATGAMAITLDFDLSITSSSPKLKKGNSLFFQLPRLPALS